MAISLSKENFILHKIHSLTGVVPVGFYMLQHLTLNSFSLAGPERFNGVINFFESIPKHVLILLEVCMIWIPLFFHAAYGFAIVNRAKGNLSNPNYGRFKENRFYSYQRISGVIALLFIIAHFATTTVAKYISGNAETIKYAAMQHKLTSFGYLPFVIYLIGIAAAAYHFSFGLWGFSIRWGLIVKQESQDRFFKCVRFLFIGVLLLGWGALAGFLIHKPEAAAEPQTATAMILSR